MGSLRSCWMFTCKFARPFHEATQVWAQLGVLLSQLGVLPPGVISVEPFHGNWVLSNLEVELLGVLVGDSSFSWMVSDAFCNHVQPENPGFEKRGRLLSCAVNQVTWIQPPVRYFRTKLHQHMGMMADDGDPSNHPRGPKHHGSFIKALGPFFPNNKPQLGTVYYHVWWFQDVSSP